MFANWSIAGLLVLLSITLSGCATTAAEHRQNYPSQGVVRWHGHKAQIPSNLAADVQRTYEKLSRQEVVDSRFLIDGAPVVNAYAAMMPEGPTVVINAGLIDMTGWDMDEMAFVIGHELAHISLGHLASAQQEKRHRQDLISDVVGTIAGALIPLGGLAVDAGNEMIKASYSRDQERDADTYGLRLMLSSGYDPQGAIRFHQKLMRVSDRQLIPFLSSHPSGEERISRLQQQIIKLQP
ncbi:MAG: M48 family metallopeptidase [Motiliproteus sp.]